MLTTKCDRTAWARGRVGRRCPNCDSGCTRYCGTARGEPAPTSTPGGNVNYSPLREDTTSAAGVVASEEPVKARGVSRLSAGVGARARTVSLLTASARAGGNQRLFFFFFSRSKATFSKCFLGLGGQTYWWSVPVFTLTTKTNKQTKNNSR